MRGSICFTLSFLFFAFVHSQTFGNDCADAVAIEEDIKYIANTEEATFSVEGLKFPDICGAGEGNAAFFKFDIPIHTIRLEITTCFPETTFDSVISIFTGDCKDLTCVTSDDNSCDKQETIIFDETNMPSSNQLIFAISGKTQLDFGTFAFRVSTGALNDHCSRAVVVKNRETIYGDIAEAEYNYDQFGTKCEFYTYDNRALFYKYIIEMEKSLLLISGCIDETFIAAGEISVFLADGDDCSLICIDVVNSQKSLCGGPEIIIDLEEFSVGKELIIAYSQSNTNIKDQLSTFDKFELYFQEYSLEAGCDEAVLVKPFELTLGLSAIGMETLADLKYPTCEVPEDLLIRPITFFNYETTIDFGLVVVSACTNIYVNERGLADYVTVWTGECDDLKCLESDPCTVYIDSKFPVGTILTIGVHGILDNSFDVVVTEQSEKTAPASCQQAEQLQENIPVYSDTSLSKGKLNESPVVFYQYRPQHGNSNIVYQIIAEFEFLVDVFISDDCNNIYSNEYENELSEYLYEIPNRVDWYGPEAIFTFAIYGENPEDAGAFSFVVYEDDLVIGDRVSTCDTAYEIESMQIARISFDAFTPESITFCGLLTSGSINSSPIVFYKYRTLYTSGKIYIEGLRGLSFDYDISAASNSCDNPRCASVSKTGTNTYKIDNSYAAGTEVIIAFRQQAIFGGLDEIEFFIQELLPDASSCTSANVIQNHETLEGKYNIGFFFASLANYGFDYCQPPQEFSRHNNPVQFLEYTTVYDSSEIRISLCETFTDFDSYLTIYRRVADSCEPDSFECLATNDNFCGPFSAVFLDEELSAGTRLLIVVQGPGGIAEKDVEEVAIATTKDLEVPGVCGLFINFQEQTCGNRFSITVDETRPPPSNDLCPNAIPLTMGIPVSGTSESSRSFSSSLPSCGTGNRESEVVFYSYVTQFAFSDITISTCGTALFDTFISVYQGSCDSLLCISGEDDTPGCGLSTTVELDFRDNLEAGVPLTIAVHGFNEEFGDFTIEVTEVTGCTITGPEYECETSFSILTDHPCATGGQCATIPDYSLGFCYDASPDCGCEVFKTSGVNPEDEVVAGYYEIYSVARNAKGIESDPCSYRITVIDSCDPLGPKMSCPIDRLDLQTSFSCQTESGEQCSFLPQLNPGTCSDFSGSCSCDVSQISGPTTFEQLVAGNYTVVFSALSSAGIPSSEPCEIPIHVENTCNPDGPSIECPESFEMITTLDCLENESQCAVMPLIPLGPCEDSCSCEVSQTTGPLFGDHVVAGIHTVVRRGSNIFGYETSCSFDVSVTNFCNADGPILTDCKEDIDLFFDPVCQSRNGFPCSFVPEDLAPGCEDSCDCSVVQVGGPEPGTALPAGEFLVAFEAINEFGIVSQCDVLLVSQPQPVDTPTPDTVPDVSEPEDPEEPGETAEPEEPEETVDEVTGVDNTPVVLDPNVFNEAELEVQLNSCSDSCTLNDANQFIEELAETMGLPIFYFSVEQIQGNLIYIDVCCAKDIDDIVSSAFSSSGLNATLINARYSLTIQDQPSGFTISDFFGSTTSDASALLPTLAVVAFVLCLF